MANINHSDFRISQLNRVKSYLKEKGCKTPTELSYDLHIKYSKILGIVHYLKQDPEFTFLTNGRSTLIAIKEGGKEPVGDTRDNSGNAGYTIPC